MEDSSIGEAAYRRIRSDIVFGRLAPGQRLGLDRMREAYGASISTLRELLSRLASEDLVVAEGQRGFEVAPVSAADLREVAALRLLLETHALEQSFAAGSWTGKAAWCPRTTSSRRWSAASWRVSQPMRPSGSVMTGNSTTP
ncbi:GntR family transcriptional regulator [Pseudoroseomonas wenyumeiae]